MRSPGTGWGRFSVCGLPSDPGNAFLGWINSYRLGQHFIVRFNAVQFPSHERLDRGDVKGVALVGKADGGAAGTRPAGASDAMHVIFGIMGQREVDDVIHPLNVNTTAGHVRSDHDPDFSALEIIEPVNPASLGDIAGEFGTIDAVTGQPFGEAPDLVFPVTEDQYPLQILSGNDVEQQVKFLVFRHNVNDLVHRIDGHLLRCYFHRYRVDGPLGGEAGNFPGQGGAEKEGLALFPGGVLWMIMRTSGIKPISSIRSASSMIITSTFFRVMSPRL